MLQVELNRYDGRAALDQLRPQNVTMESGSSFIALRLNGDEEFGFYFPASDGVGTAGYLELARDVLENLAGMDNDVQRRCAAECARTKLHRRNFEGCLAYGTLGPAGVALHYYGTGVNTEWDEKFARVEGKWIEESTRD